MQSGVLKTDRIVLGQVFILLLPQTMTEWSGCLRLASLAVVHDAPNAEYIMHRINISEICDALQNEAMFKL